ncbi:MAG: hypothetical protein ACR2JE_09080, partial [Acidobacteriaceae bacterium]
MSRAALVSTAHRYTSQKLLSAYMPVARLKQLARFSPKQEQAGIPEGEHTELRPWYEKSHCL